MSKFHDSTICDCGGELYVVIVQSADVVQDTSGQTIRIADSEEVWRCPDCGQEYLFDAEPVEA